MPIPKAVRIAIIMSCLIFSLPFLPSLSLGVREIEGYCRSYADGGASRYSVVWEDVSCRSHPTASFTCAT